MKIAFLLLIFLSVSTYGMASISKNDDDDDQDLERQVQMMTRSPMKTYVTKEGKTIDCVEIDKQPTLDLPLLKNHKVQIEPDRSFVHFHTPTKVKFARFESRQLCPVGSVPIPRVSKEDLIRARSMAKMSSSKSQNSLSPHVTVFMRDEMTENTKYGGYGISNVYNLTVAHDQAASHNIWIQNGPLEHASMIIAGWQVAPPVYGDSVPRFFTYWTGDGQNGCFNMDCPGFVQTDRSLTPGSIIKESSIYDGKQIEISIDIHQDASRDKWWLTVNKGIVVGYWPSKLFLHLRNGSKYTGWGGIGRSGGDGICPPMGSGHKPDGNCRHATYFREIQWVDAAGVYQLPSKEVGGWVDKSNVYDLKNYGTNPPQMGYWISFGGPGGNCEGRMDG